MRPITLILLIVLTLSLTLPVSTLLAASITVSTDKNEYYAGDVVTIYGTAPADTQVAIQVKDPAGTTVWVDQKTAGSDGKFTSKFRLKSDAKLGIYKVTASSNVGKATTTFKVVSKPGPPPPPPPSPEEKAQNAISRAESEISCCEKLFKVLSEFMNVSKYVSMLEEAKAKLEDAKNSFAAENYDKAYEQAVEARDIARQAWQGAVEEAKDILSDMVSELEAVEDPVIQKLIELVKEILEETFYTACDATILGDAYTYLRAAKDLVTIEEIKGEMAELEEAKKELESKIADLEAKLEELKASKEELEDQMSKLKEENVKLQALVGEYEKFKSEYEKVKADKEKLESELESLKSELEDLKARMAEPQRMQFIMLAAGLVIGLLIGFLLAKMMKKS
ncbi:MAG: hypothetical protein DRJ37_04320 [Thermoprotei archaeon]|nr:MAG: hypothetical protein DRJ37_04320 [Thermoprotei archaeon]